MTLKITAQLFENRLVVWDPDEGSALYNMGFYGKPVGIAKPKPTGFTVPLTTFSGRSLKNSVQRS